MRYTQLVLALILTVFSTSLAPAAPKVWEQLVPRKAVPADPNQQYNLSDTNGPWLVMATSFSGEEGEAQARELVLELRSKFRLPAYYYGMTFKMEESNPGRGIDDHGAPIKKRYNRGNIVVEHAVMVGEFPSVDDAEAQKLLKQIKQITPETLKIEQGEENTQSLAGIRAFQNMVRQQIAPDEKRGPMGHAFLTRNPILPKEYFVPQGVDNEVAKWNEGLEYSLMKCPGKYSIRVATFRGRIIFDTGEEEPKNNKTRAAKEKDPLVEAAKNAHLLATALREKGWEAYEFHDRHESYVTVGSFDEGQQFEDGSVALAGSEAQTIVNTFGAATPNNIFEKPAAKDQQLEELQKQRFSNLFSQRGETFAGLHPKRFVGLPFDIIPEPVYVPKKSISSTYARN
jgi:hypothetical protein